MVGMVMVVGGEEGSQLVSWQAGEGQLAQVAEHDGSLRALLLAHLSRGASQFDEAASFAP